VVLAHLLLGHNVFKGPSPEESRKLVMNMPLPDFRTLDGRIDDRLNQILLKALSRDLNKRYGSADEMLFDLEHYIYHSGYGPTNETLGRMIREIFGYNVRLATEDAKGSTQLLERTARSTAIVKPK
jgi:serine/threonine-protein kinase